MEQGSRGPTPLAADVHRVVNGQLYAALALFGATCAPTLADEPEIAPENSVTAAADDVPGDADVARSKSRNTQADATTEPLSFGFLQSPPGRLVSIGSTRLHIVCQAADAGQVTVLFEAGLGGNALEWTPVIDALGGKVRACTYDRAGYGWSDPSIQPRHALRLAYELDQLTDAAELKAPFVLVAHSFGGFVARLFAERRPSDVAGIVLIDTSHEKQFERLEQLGGKQMMPRNRQFVISQSDPPDSLPHEIRRKLQAFSRMRKTYSATHGEMATFRESAAQVASARRSRSRAHDFPITVIRRGLDLYAGQETGAARTAVWAELQQDLALLGSPSRVVIAEQSGHHVHADEPELVATEILRLIEGHHER